MTAAEEATSHDVPPTFVWKQEYQDQLRGIAETDEVPDSLDWPALKQAIKYQIRQTLAVLPDDPLPLLHPAARAIYYRSTAASQPNSKGMLQQHHQQQGNGAIAPSPASPSSSASSSSSQHADQGSAMSVAGDATSAGSDLEQRFMSSSSSSAAPTSTGLAAPIINPDETNGSDSETDVSDFQWVSQDGRNLGLGAELPITDADRSGFFPAKTPPMTRFKTSWGRTLSASDKEAETSMILAMLDDFDESPPFTIQRLAELVLEPNRYVRSSAKYLSSLTRILGMTASHRDFPPVSPGTAPGALSTTVGNGVVGGMDDLQRMTGPPSPTSAPIFSPIPFLQRSSGQENGHSQSSGGDVPDLDLSDVSNNSIASSHSDELGGASNQAGPSRPRIAEVNPSPPPVSLTEPASSLESSASVSEIPSSSSGVASVAPTFGASGSTQPLGVPHGRVDEFDEYRDEGGAAGSSGAVTSSSPSSSSSSAAAAAQGAAVGEHRMDSAMHPLSSTTTTTTAPAATTSQDNSGACERSSSTAEEDEADDDDKGRQIKRMRSEASLSDLSRSHAAQAPESK